ncbi:MAG: methyltransferase [Planctomycetes bacterium]|nr:methyltransferase [Planctomycetota bacterium]
MLRTHQEASRAAIVRERQPAMDEESVFDWVDGEPFFHGLPVLHKSIEAGGRIFTIAGVKDAADLLDDSEIGRRFIEEDIAPYGLELWPSAVMLARQVMTGESGQGRAAIELGCGLGLVSLAASTANWSVEATDNDTDALAFTNYNAQLNHVRLAGSSVLDWHDSRPPLSRTRASDTPRGLKPAAQDGVGIGSNESRYVRVFAADVLYQAVDHDPILRCIDGLLDDGGVAVLVDPNRGVADRFGELAEKAGFRVGTTPTSTRVDNERTVNARIFELTRA